MPTKLVIVGRPNVGKSTLFNRLVGKRKALVYRDPGTTRDRNNCEFIWKNRKFIVTDTAGWSDSDVSIFSKEMLKQLNIAIEESDIILFVVDAKSGINLMDFCIANKVRSSHKEVFLIVNKIDTQMQEVRGYEFYELGFDRVVFISADHGRNIYYLLDKICGIVKYNNQNKETEKILKIIFVGKPNVGKSLLVNSISKKERSIVHDISGTTRDSISVNVYDNNSGKEYILIDTAGIHRGNKVVDDMEYLSALSTNYAIDDADIAILVADASSCNGIGEIEVKISRLLLGKKKPTVVAFNKWDLIKNKEEAMKHFISQFKKKIKFMDWANIIFISAKTGQRLNKIFYEVESIFKQYSKEVNQEKLNEVIKNALIRKQYTTKGKILKLKKYIQISSKPPVFVFSVNDIKLIHFSYVRFLENCLRENFGFFGTPIILKFRKY